MSYVADVERQRVGWKATVDTTEPGMVWLGGRPAFLRLRRRAALRAALRWAKAAERREASRARVVLS